MCGIEARQNATEARAILRQVARYLEDNNEIIIESIITNLESNQEKSYIDDLKENRINFKKSIKGDFEWMKDYAKVPIKQKVNIDNPKYDGIYVVSSLHLGYCDFYQEFSKYIKLIDKSDAVKSRLEKLTTALYKKYKCI
jgi:hypothetical protein